MRFKPRWPPLNVSTRSRRSFHLQEIQWTDYNHGQESWTKTAFVRPNPPPPNKKRTQGISLPVPGSKIEVQSCSKSDTKNPWELAASYFRLACFIFATSLLSENLAHARYFPKDSTVLWGHPEITSNYNISSSGITKVSVMPNMYSKTRD